MAPPDGPAAEVPRDFTSELEALGERLAEAERYLGREKLQARRDELEAEAAKPTSLRLRGFMRRPPPQKIQRNYKTLSPIHSLIQVKIARSWQSDCLGSARYGGSGVDFLSHPGRRHGSVSSDGRSLNLVIFRSLPLFASHGCRAVSRSRACVVHTIVSP